MASYLQNHDWRTTLENAGIDSTPRKGKPCPACGGRDRFTMFESGRHLCRWCGAGDSLDLIQKVYDCDFKKAIEFVVGSSQSVAPAREKSPRMTDEQRESRKAERVKRIIDECVPWTYGSEVFRYLTESRNFAPCQLSTELMEMSQLGYWHETAPGKFEEIGRYTAMVAPVKNQHDGVIAVHLTYLLDGNKAPVPAPKKIIGSPKGGVIKLFPPKNNQIGIAEGIETALSTSALYGIPTWAALSASLMPAVNLSDELKDVYVFADNDQAGLKAAWKLVDELAANGRRPRTPTVPGLQLSDFDELRKQNNVLFNITTRP